jgi:hypothetical protein
MRSELNSYRTFGAAFLLAAQQVRKLDRQKSSCPRHSKPGIGPGASAEEEFDLQSPANSLTHHHTRQQPLFWVVRNVA